MPRYQDNSAAMAMVDGVLTEWTPPRGTAFAYQLGFVIPERTQSLQEPGRRRAVSADAVRAARRSQTEQRSSRD